MRYYVTVRIDRKLTVVGEVVADVAPPEDPDYVYPDDPVKALRGQIDDPGMPASLSTASELAQTREGVMAVAAWRRDDDNRWDRARLALNLGYLTEGTRGDLELLAGKGDTNAALLLREGSLQQQVDYLEADVGAPA